MLNGGGGGSIAADGGGGGLGGLGTGSTGGAGISIPLILESIAVGYLKDPREVVIYSKHHGVNHSGDKQPSDQKTGIYAKMFSGKISGARLVALRH